LTNHQPSLTVELNFSPSISGIGGTDTPLKIVSCGTSSSIKWSSRLGNSPERSSAPKICSVDAPIATEAKRVQNKDTGRRRITAMVYPQRKDGDRRARQRRQRLEK
jgi:hypothetical protein